MTSPTVMMTFDLSALLTQLKRDENWPQKPQHTITLRDTERLRVVLMALHGGAVIPPHQVEGPMTAQVIAGRMRFRAGPESALLGPGQLVTLPARVQHEVEALEDTVFLLSRLTD